ncbi:MAG: type II toxin-antitoxin system HicA family toxin [Pseudoxanthomonas sp.]
MSAKEVEAVLKHLGFTPRKQKATSHVNWVRGEGTQDYKRVTVDANNEPFKDQALKWMLNQAGISKKDFYAILAQL